MSRRAARAGSAGLAAFALGLAAAAAAESIESHAESGPVSALVRVEPAAPRIGDPIQLTLEVRAEAGVELLMPAFGDALDRFAIVDFAPSEQPLADGGSVSRQRYTLQPSRSGPQSIPPLLVEFVDRRPGRSPAPEGEDAHELLTERIDFEVEAMLPEDAPLTLRPAQGALPPLAEPGPPLWPVAAAGAVALAVAAPFAARLWLARRARRLQRSAFEVARAELDALLYGPRPDASAMDPFFVKLSGIARRYVEHRFGLHSPELTTEEFLEGLSTSPELLRSQRELLQDFLRRADLVKFAHHVPAPEDVEASIRAVERFLEATRDEVAAHA